VHPLLLSFMEDVFAKAPNLLFEANSTMDNAFVSEAVVWFDDQIIGAVGILRRQTENKGVIEEYHISSKLIHKAKGRNRDTKVTSSRKSALKTALSVFKAMPVNQVVSEYIDEAESMIRSNKISATRALTVKEKSEDKIAALHYVLDTVRSDSPAPPSDFIKDRVLSLAKELDTLRIAQSIQNNFSSNNGLLLIVERTGALKCIDLLQKQMTLLQDTTQLPKNYQDKFALLHIVDDSQAVEHVGMKWVLTKGSGSRVEQTVKDAKGYFLVAGDTVAY
jgi:hypothetical protein